MTAAGGGIEASGSSSDDPRSPSSGTTFCVHETERWSYAASSTARHGRQEQDRRAVGDLVSSPPSRRTSSPSTNTLRKLGTPSPSSTRLFSAGYSATSRRAPRARLPPRRRPCGCRRPRGGARVGCGSAAWTSKDKASEGSCVDVRRSPARPDRGGRDDHPPRSQQLLEENGFDVVGEARDGLEAVELARDDEAGRRALRHQDAGASTASRRRGASTPSGRCRS